MTLKMYYDKPYDKEFTAKVEKVQGDELLLDQTLFYPGGGGQSPDKGTMNGKPVEGMRKDGENIWHKVPGHGVEVGSEVEGKLDWERRYRLMKGHTAEHIFFGTLNKANPELRTAKVILRRNRFSVFINGPLKIEEIGPALTRVNSAILKGAKVNRKMVPVEDAKKDPGIRGKWDAVAGDEASCILVEGVDGCACAGVHISNISELKAVAVKRMVTTNEADWQVDYVFGKEAMEILSGDNGMILEEINGLTVSRETLTQTVSNMKDELEGRRESMVGLVRIVLEGLKPEVIGENQLFTFCFDHANPKELNRWAIEKAKGERTIVLIGNRAKNLTVLLARSDDIEMNAVSVLKESLKPYNGGGGGKDRFCQGGVAKETDWEELKRAFLERF